MEIWVDPAIRRTHHGVAEQELRLEPPQPFLGQQPPVSGHPLTFAESAEVGGVQAQEVDRVEPGFIGDDPCRRRGERIRGRAPTPQLPTQLAPITDLLTHQPDRSERSLTPRILLAD